MNSVILIGNLARDPELRYSTGMNQTAICRFTVAVNDRRRNAQGEWEDNASFIPIVVFGKQAENCDKYLSKGRKVAVSGRIQTGSYTNKEGNKVYTTEVIANNVEFLGGGNAASGTGYGQGQQSFGGYGQNQNQGFGQQGGYGQQQAGGFAGEPYQAPAPQQPQGGFGQEEPFQAAPQGDQGIPDGFQALQDDDIPF